MKLLKPAKHDELKEGIVVKGGRILLPMPELEGRMSVEEAIATRRSIRSYERVPLKIEQVAQILWAAQGITDPRRGLRATPSAGAIYPLNVYLVVGEDAVIDLPAGIYRYDASSHSLIILRRGDVREELARAALEQPWVKEAPISLVITAVYERTTSRYGSRGIRYVHIEVGHVGQNVYLQAVALGLGTVAVGAFYDDEVRVVLGVGEDEQPLYIMPIGVPERIYKPTLDELKEYYERHRGD
ncbi:MAG: SagB/ThcOx family dehydrogenase [Thermoprotei archaeon]|nr:SagB/ThcOx family dehydrogenase [Thermoprotei archaeon]